MSAESLNRNTFNLKILLVLSFGHMATDVCQSALPAVLPFLKEKLALSYAMAGALMLASNVASSVIQPLFGHMSDRKEKAFLLPLGCLCAGLGISLLAMAPNYELVLLLVIISGFGIASYHPEGFKTARFFTGDKMATGLAVFTVGGNVGLALGPMVATFIIAHFGLGYFPLIMLFSLTFLVLLALSWRTLGQVHPTAVSQGGSKARVSRAAYTSLALIVAAVVMRSWTHFGIMAFIPFYYIDYEKGDPLYAGTLVSTFLAGGVVGTLAGSRFADSWGHKRYLIVSLAITTALFPLIFLTHGIMLFVALGVVGATLISTFTVTMVMAQDLMPESHGVASGLMAGFAIGTGGIGVTLLGVIADNFGVPTALKSIILLPLLGLLISCFVKYPLPRPKTGAA
ncbi:MAG: MFS transporter [Pseudomonadota bacterium]